MVDNHLFFIYTDAYSQRPMKLSAVLLSTLLFTPVAAFAGGSTRVYEESHCYRNTEEYVPGYYNKHGQYVGGYVKHDREKIPCGHYHGHSAPQKPHQTDSNSCIEGSILGGILGGGAGAALSRGDGRWWAIPLGVVGGSMVGCQVDGG